MVRCWYSAIAPANHWRWGRLRSGELIDVSLLLSYSFLMTVEILSMLFSEDDKQLLFVSYKATNELL